MTRLIPLALAAALLAAPAAAQDSEGDRLFEEGANLLLRGLIEEVAPPLQELAGLGREVLPALQALGQEFGPALSDVIGRIDSITYYEPPVIAPNGDIVLRRRADAPDWVPPPPEDPEPETSRPERQPDRPPRAAPDSEDDRPFFDLSPPPEAEPLPDLRLNPDGQLEL